MTENKEVMARNIRKQMSVKGVKAVDVCKALDVKPNTFSDWVNAKIYPRIDKIEKMAAYFGISKADLVEDGSNQPTLTDVEMDIIIHMREDHGLRDRLMTYYKFLLSEKE